MVNRKLFEYFFDPIKLFSFSPYIIPTIVRVARQPSEEQLNMSLLEKKVAAAGLLTGIVLDGFQVYAWVNSISGDNSNTYGIPILPAALVVSNLISASYEGVRSLMHGSIESNKLGGIKKW